jgi:hypothetical protein
VAGKHRDKGNIGDSILVGFGNYEGGEICLESNEVESIRYRPVIFNGSQITHWNTQITSGSKYSLVYYVSKDALRLACETTAPSENTIFEKDIKESEQ